MRIALVILPLCALAGLACQSTGVQDPELRAGASIPLPATWQGPEVFELPRMKIRPDTVLVQTLTCIHSKGSQQGTSRLVGVKRDDRGLTEAQLELDGKIVGRLLYNDEGRLVHSQGDGEEANLMGLLPPEVDAAFHQPLRRNHPVVVAVPMRQLLRGGELKELPEGLGASVLEMRSEYLGQTEFDGVQAAAHRVTAEMTPISIQGAELRMRVVGLSYSDANQGLPLYSEIGMLFSVRRGVEQVMAERMSCRQVLDRAASHGL